MQAVGRELIDEKGIAILRAFQTGAAAEIAGERGPDQAGYVSADEAVTIIQRTVERFATICCRRDGKPELIEDVVQESVTALLRAAFRGTCSIDTYLYAVVRSHFIKLSKWASMHRHLEIGLDEVADIPLEENSILERMASRASVETLVRLISGFDESEKEIVNLLILNFSQKQIAAKTNIPYDTLRQKIVRLRQKLRDRINDSQR